MKHDLKKKLIEIPQHVKNAQMRKQLFEIRKVSEIRQADMGEKNIYQIINWPSDDLPASNISLPWHVVTTT